MSFPHKKSAFLLMVLISIVAYNFWTGSRYPELNLKADLVGSLSLDALGFDIVYEVDEKNTRWENIVYSSVNWLATNKKGMIFGVLLAALLKSLLDLFEMRKWKNFWQNVFMGGAVGIPLGLCVNCSAPVAKGMHDGGASKETSIVAMLSSPTLNVIVLSMLLALFPVYMVVLKVFFTLVLILFAVPVFFFLEKKKVLPLEINKKEKKVETPKNFPPPTWFGSFFWVGKNFSKNLWLIFKTTVPLMFVAALLGGIVITFLPWETMISFLPGSGKVSILIAMIILSLVATFLPVPIAFDVLLSATLFSAGLPARYSMILLFTLGIYSIYATFITYYHISRTLSIYLFVVTVVLGVLCGGAGHYFEKWHKQYELQLMKKELLNASEEQRTISKPNIDSISLEKIKELIEKENNIVFSSENFPKNIMLQYKNYANSSSSEANTPFYKHTGKELGLDMPFKFSPRKAHIYFAAFNRSIASGDIHNDGWVDVVVSGDYTFGGLVVFANINGKKFVPQKIDLGEYSEAYIVNTCLVDLNNDGWLDLYFSTYKDGNFFIQNDNGNFYQENIHQINANATTTSLASGFADLDKDGNLDIVLGNYSVSWSRKIPLKISQNLYLLQKNNTFIPHYLEDVPQETHNILLSDINEDGYLDLFVGNDWSSDKFFWGKDKSIFQEILYSDGIVKETCRTTMSVDSADLNNDLHLELFWGQISDDHNFSHLKKMPHRDSLWKEFDNPKQQNDYKEEIELVRKISRYHISLQYPDSLDKQTLHDVLIYKILMDSKNFSAKNEYKFLPNFSYLEEIKKRFSSERYQNKEKKQQIIPEQRKNNLLLFWDGKTFNDKANEWNISKSDWTWNAKFADLDQDEYQDLYVANGMWQKEIRESNYFYRNVSGAKLEEATAKFALGDHFCTSAYTYIDFDNDGDLDIITVPMDAPMRLFKNNSQEKNSICFSLQDNIGNRSGIGSKIFIYYKNRHQLRELKLSGGFTSYDSPLVHFGMGEEKEVERVEVLWSTGERTILEDNFPVGRLYTITRSKK